MHAMHARLPKNFVLEERLERYSSVIEIEPARLKGSWASMCFPSIGQAPALHQDIQPQSSQRRDEFPLAILEQQSHAFDNVFLDLGCGKGSYLCSMAQQKPKTLFIGVDNEPICIAYTAQRIHEMNLSNAIVVPGLARNLLDYFNQAELSCIQLNFPTPFPRKRDAARRLVSTEHLMIYRELLGPHGKLRLKTDSLPLRDFACDELEYAGYEIIASSNDARADNPSEPTSEYERRLCQQGAVVFELVARPHLPAHNTYRGPVSLMDYLPSNLDTLDYIPHGMQAAVVNLKNRRLNAKSAHT